MARGRATPQAQEPSCLPRCACGGFHQGSSIHAAYHSTGSHCGPGGEIAEPGRELRERIVKVALGIVTGLGVQTEQTSLRSFRLAREIV